METVEEKERLKSKLFGQLQSDLYMRTTTKWVKEREENRQHIDHHTLTHQEERLTTWDGRVMWEREIIRSIHRKRREKEQEWNLPIDLIRRRTTSRGFKSLFDGERQREPEEKKNIPWWQNRQTCCGRRIEGGLRRNLRKGTIIVFLFINLFLNW